MDKKELTDNILEKLFDNFVLEGVIFEKNGEMCITKPAYRSFGAFTYWLGNKNMTPFAAYEGKNIRLKIEVLDI